MNNDSSVILIIAKLKERYLYHEQQCDKILKRIKHYEKAHTTKDKAPIINNQTEESFIIKRLKECGPLSLSDIIVAMNNTSNKSFFEIRREIDFLIKIKAIKEQHIASATVGTSKWYGLSEWFIGNSNTLKEEYFSKIKNKIKYLLNE